MTRNLLGTACIIVLGASGAQAADVTYQDPWNWDGWYAGLNAGVAVLDGDATLSGPFIPGTPVLDLSDTGFTGGLTLGRNWQSDQWLFGIEGDINILDLDDTLTFSTGKGTGALRADYDWFATIRGRLGRVSEDNNTVVYGTGGIAFLDSNLTLTDLFIPTTASDSSILVGFAIGAGIEHMFSEQWSGKVEYLYMGFGSETLTTTLVTATIDPSLHVVRVGLNRHFCYNSAC